MSKKIATITTTILATIGVLATAAAVLYKKGYLAVEVEKDESKEEPKTGTIKEESSVVVEPEIVEEATKKHKIIKKKIVKE